MSIHIVKLTMAASTPGSQEIDLADGIIVEIQAELEGTTGLGQVGFKLVERERIFAPVDQSPEPWIWLHGEPITLRDQYTVIDEPPKVKVMAINGDGTNPHTLAVRIVTSKITERNLAEFAADALKGIVRSQGDLLTKIVDIIT